MAHINRVRDLWENNRPVANGWLSLGSPLIAELYGGQGFDSVTVDMQHGMFGIGEALGSLQAIRATGATPLARVPQLEAGIVSKVLDAGALGVICPLIDTPDQAAELVSYVRYPPLGQRSSGPTRAGLIYPDYTKVANGELLAFAMIETQSGMDNLDAIARTPGLDGLYIGPSDLSLSLTNGRLGPGFDRQEPEMIEAIRKIIDGAHKAGIKVGLHCGSSEYAAKAIGWGADLVTLLNDARMIAAAAADAVKRFRTALAP
jgi:4-hydroxy-2-oxoheptanedioate aldolase